MVSTSYAPNLDILQLLAVWKGAVKSDIFSVVSAPRDAS